VAIDVERDLSRGWVRARASGTLSVDDVLDFIRTVRAPIQMRMCPLIFDARSCRMSSTLADVERAVELVRSVVNDQHQRRAHVALVADDDGLYRWFLEYETRCGRLGVRVIRVFRHQEDAERWLEIVSAARELS
jgi:hypothetical protein